ncbi:MAG: tetratricopeptide repeat protein [Candidatus Eisenbacteria bacterium]
MKTFACGPKGCASGYLGLCLMVALVCLLMTGVAWAAAPLGDINAVFNDGCDLYEQGDFDLAAGHFESLVARGVKSAEVYYNLGNCYYKQGLVGRAVASYRRGGMLSPRDSDIKTNLSLVRSVVGFRDTTASYDLGGVALLPLRIASPRELTLVFYVGYYLTTICFVSGLMLKGGLRKKNLRILVVLLVVTVGALGLARYGVSRFSSGSDGVVTADKAEFMSGPGTAFDELARLPDGVEVSLRAKSGIWVEVELSTGDIGWIREKDIEKI